jgi:small subunit ribosomal protein S1
MKLKLLVIDHLPPLTAPLPLCYYHSWGRLEHWRYAPEGCDKGEEWNAAE